jgi:ribosomal-protein-alanine N-acetyltransferase
MYASPVIDWDQSQRTLPPSMPSRPLYLQSTHLDLVAMTLVHLEAEASGIKDLALLLGVSPPKDWPPGHYDQKAMQFYRERLAAEGPGSVGWYGWYAIRRRTALQTAALVGVAGFVGPPDATGTVELGFSVLPSLRGHGHATEMAAALVDYALSQPSVERVIAHANITNRPAISVLLQSGFQAVAPGQRPGTARFERSAQASLPEGEDEDLEEAASEDEDE